MECNFKKVHTGKDLAISILVLLAGAGLYFLNPGLGICIGTCGLLMCLFYKKGYKINGKGIWLTKESEDICKECRTSIIEFLEGKNPVPVIKQGTEGGSIRLDVYFNKSENVAYAQVYDFCNYDYEPATGIIELDGDRAEKLISLL